MTAPNQDPSSNLWPDMPLTPEARARLYQSLIDNDPSFMVPPEVSSVAAVAAMAGSVASGGASTELSWLGSRN